MKTKLTVWSLTLLAILAPAARAQSELASAPGYVSIDSFGFDDDQLKVDVSVKGALLAMLVEATKDTDEAFSQLVSKLMAIRVQIVNLSPGEAESVKSKFSDLAKHLDSNAWERVVRVRENGERIDTYLKAVDNKIIGIVVMVVDPGDEAVFVNIVGEIDPAQIGRIGRKFHIKPLEGLGDDGDDVGLQIEIEKKTTPDEVRPPTNDKEPPAGDQAPRKPAPSDEDDNADNP